MNKILKTGISLLLFTPLFLSCETVDEVTLPLNEKPTVNVSTSSVTVTEGGSATITVTANRAISRPMIFKLFQIEGNAVAGEDYEFSESSAIDFGSVGGRIEIPAHEISGSVDIIGLTDFEVDNKSAKFELRSMESMNGIVGNAKEVSVSIENFIDDDLTIILSWATSDEANYAAADQDLDLFLDGGGSGFAATADFPETFVLKATEPDGTYSIDVDYWAPSDFSLPGEPILFTVEHILTIGKVGSFSTVIKNNYTDSDAVTSEFTGWSGFANFGGDGWTPGVASVVKVGNTYTIKDKNGTTVAAGKFKKKRPSLANGKAFLTLD